jgi:hypothetical protein
LLTQKTTLIEIYSCDKIDMCNGSWDSYALDGHLAYDELMMQPAIHLLYV